MEEIIKSNISRMISIAKIIIDSEHNPVIREKNKEILESLKTDTFGFFTKPYLFTTENINGYYDDLDFKDKGVLTVIGSGDHIFNAILRGATKIDAFDINSYSLMVYYLKEAAIKALSYEEFITYFLESLLKPNTKCFNVESYNKIRVFLSTETLTFWDALYEEYKEKSARIALLFKNTIPEKQNAIEAGKALSKVTSYLSEEQYYLLRQRLNQCEVNCYIRGVNSLDNLGGSYDYIFLSNIVHYQEREALTKFRDSLARYISKLNICGKITIGYIYGHWYDPETSFWALSDSLKLNGITLKKIPSFYFAIKDFAENTAYDGLVEYRKQLDLK